MLAWYLYRAFVSCSISTTYRAPAPQVPDNQRLMSHVVLGMVAVVYVFGLLEVQEGDPVLQVTDLVAYRNLVGGTKDAVL